MCWPQVFSNLKIHPSSTFLSDWNQHCNLRNRCGSLLKQTVQSAGLTYRIPSQATSHQFPLALLHFKFNKENFPPVNTQWNVLLKGSIFWTWVYPVTFYSFPASVHLFTSISFVLQSTRSDPTMSSAFCPCPLHSEMHIHSQIVIYKTLISPVISTLPGRTLAKQQWLAAHK